MSERLDGKSLDLEQVNIQKLKSIFPDCVIAEPNGTYKVDLNKLLSLLGNYSDDDFEKYSFTWNGKTNSLRLAQKRSTATLRPCLEESVNFDNTQNLYIEGDNLEVLKLLQKSYFGKVKMIYIDPPYNTGNDFIYEDDFKDPLEKYKQATNQGNKSNAETAGRFHTNWLNMMYPRLRLAANLLKEEGAIFISIDDNEQANLKKVCDEVFGEENFIALIPWRKRTAKSDVPFNISQDYEFILSYAKSEKFKAALKSGSRKYYETDDLPGRPWRTHDLTKQTSASERPNSFFTIINPKNGAQFPADRNKVWRITKDTFDRYYKEKRIVFPGDYDFLNISKPVLRYFKDDDMKKDGELFGYITVSTNLPQKIGMSEDGTREIKETFKNKVFDYPKPVALIKYFMEISTFLAKDKNSINS